MDKETKVGFTVLGVLAALIVLGLAIDSSEPTEPAADQEVPAQTKRPRRVPGDDMDALTLLYIQANIFPVAVDCQQKRVGDRLYAGCRQVLGDWWSVWLYEDGQFMPLNGDAQTNRERMPARHPKIRDLDHTILALINVGEVVDAFRR